MNSVHQLVKFHNHTRFSHKPQNFTIQVKFHKQYQHIIIHQHSNILNDSTSD